MSDRLPHGWDVVPLGRLLRRTQYGLSVRGERSGAYPMLRMNNLEEGEVAPDDLQFVDQGKWALEDYKLHRGDLLFNRTNSLELVGKVALFNLDGDYLFASYLLRLSVDPLVVAPEYLNYYLNADRTQRRLKQLATRGVSQSNINATKLQSLTIDLPCLSEQRAIARALHAVKEARKARQRELALERERKAALMGHLFTRGTRPNGEPQTPTPFGPIPERWASAALSECAHVQTGVTKGRDLRDDATTTLPYLRVANVQNGFLDLSAMKDITLRVSEVDRYRLQIDDVVVTEGGDFDQLGRGFIWKGQIPNCIHQNHIFAVRTVKDRLDPHFFAFLIQSDYGRQYFLSVAHKTTNLACINSAKLKAFPIPLPPLREQAEIAALLGACDTKIRTVEREVSLLDELFRALLDELMAGRLSAAPLIESETAP